MAGIVTALRAPRRSMTPLSLTRLISDELEIGFMRCVVRGCMRRRDSYVAACPGHGRLPESYLCRRLSSRISDLRRFLSLATLIDLSPTFLDWVVLEQHVLSDLQESSRADVQYAVVMCLNPECDWSRSPGKLQCETCSFTEISRIDLRSSFDRVVDVLRMAGRHPPIDHIIHRAMRFYESKKSLLEDRFVEAVATERAGPQAEPETIIFGSHDRQIDL